MSRISVVLLSLFFVQALGGQPSQEEFISHRELEQSLLDSKINSTIIPNLYVLAESFFPAGSLEPVCVPVQYHIDCQSQENNSLGCIDCTSSAYNTSFLWTNYDVSVPIGSVLLSYALDGIELLGFNSWEDACSFSDTVDLQLSVSSLSICDENIVLGSLQKITSQLKKYAADQGKPKVGDTSNNGYAIQWNNEDQAKVFNDPNIILTVEFIFLNIFIYLLSITMTTYSYDNLYKNVKRKKNPGYPIFWGLVVFTFCWNVAPSWLVLLRYSNRVHYSLAVMIPLELIVAVVVKKKSDFPIPGMSPHGCRKHHSGYHFTLEKVVLSCCRCLVCHIVQAIAIWSILVFITFLVYYLSAIIVTFYLYPTETLIKVVFLKGIAVSTILIFALIFSQSKFKFKCTSKALKNNVVAVMTLLTVISILPILAYLAFVIGGILFAESSDSNNLRSILTLLPSAFLLFIAWASRGHLFPEGLHDTDPAKEIVSDLEKGATHEDKHSHDKGNDDNHVQVPLTPTTPVRVSGNQGQHGELSSYNSLDRRQPLTLQASLHGSVDGERKPLIQS